jgi:phosphoesterase RecJ-like protein
MSLARINSAFKRHKSFLISTHVSPDPDALCSELALALFLKSLGKRVAVINEEPVPARFSFFPRVGLIKSVKGIPRVAYDAAVIVDCGDLQRIGKVERLLDPKKPVINIDHHITNEGFGSLNFVDPEASSTAEMLFDLLKKAKGKMTEDIAILLYMGIMTDTGSFRYDNTTPRTHEVIGELMRFKIPVNELYRRLYERVPFSDMKMFMRVVSGLELCYGGKVVCVELSKKLMDKFSEDFDLREKIFSFLRSINGIEVLMILSEQNRKKTRVNFRSQGRIDVAKLAAHFGGGGHMKASGCVLEHPVTQTKKMVLKQLEKSL